MLKRISSLLLFAVVLTFVAGPAQAAKPLSPNTSFETTDGTTVPLVGEVVSGGGDGPGWFGPWISPYLPLDITYDNSRSATGKWSLLLDTVDRIDEEPQIGRVFDKSMKKGLLLIRVQISRTDKNSLGIFITNGDPHINNVGGIDPSGQAIYVGIDPEKFHNLTPGGGDIAAQDGAGGVVLEDDAVAPNMWHELQIEFNCNKDDGVYDVYLNGKKLNTTPLHFRFPQESLDRVYIYTGSNQNQDGSSAPEIGAKHWIEDVVLWRK